MSDRRMDGWMARRRTKSGDISAAELKAQALLKSIDFGGLLYQTNRWFAFKYVITNLPLL